MQQSCVDSYFSETLRGSGSSINLLVTSYSSQLGPLAWTLNFWQDAICEYLEEAPQLPLPTLTDRTEKAGRQRHELRTEARLEELGNVAATSQRASVEVPQNLGSP
ncbi:uncharacterized protein FRV6_07632 [Fusarium oxysporum]|uniref:Uncharacterized protein n=1 Tax=Fusarium oxysporum TaxID=5507 RepID=A0A2H3T772_FUSOX|nr:uncharacterized protein FRV6_07632 [Fusarium oxysporum]